MKKKREDNRKDSTLIWKINQLIMMARMKFYLQSKRERECVCRKELESERESLGTERDRACLNFKDF